MLPSISIFGVRIWMWGLMNTLAALSVLMIALHDIRYRRVDALDLKLMWAWSLVGAAIGAHLYYLAAVRPPGQSWRDVFRLMNGTAIQGGMIGGPAGALLYLWRRRIAALPMFDVMAPGAAFATGVTRLGCFAAGCCYGKPTSLPWGVVFSHPNSDAPVGVPLHPSQLYETALDFLLAWYLQAELKSGRGSDGRIYFMYVGGYSLIRFCVQFTRGDDAERLFWGLAHSQFMAGGMFLIAAAFLLRQPAASNARP